jgi:hypothetical protein
MENGTTPTWLKESLSAVRRAPSADPQATGALAFKRPPLAVVEYLHEEGCTDGHDAGFRGERKSHSGCEPDNRAIFYGPHLAVVAVDARKLMLFGN